MQMGLQPYISYKSENISAVPNQQSDEINQSDSDSSSTTRTVPPRKYDFSPIKITEDSRLIVPSPFKELQRLGYKRWREIMNEEEKKIIDETTLTIVRNVGIG